MRECRAKIWLEIIKIRSLEVYTTLQKMFTLGEQAY
jgi:hypothetical protein